MENAIASKLLIGSLVVLLVIGIGDAIALGVWFWGQAPIYDGTTSGVWTALAYDASLGEVYRPVVSDIGFGGTRYVPISFLGHAGLILAGIEPIPAGMIWMQATVFAMCAAIAILIFQQGGTAIWALGLAAITLCTSIYQQYLTEVNADYAAAAISLFALAVFIARGPLALVAILGAAAVFTKFTSLYVPGAVLVYLITQSRFREAIAFVITGVGSLLVLFIFFQWLSQGQMWASLVATASGGTDWVFALGFSTRFLEEIFVSNPAIGVCFLLALWVWAASPNKADAIALSFWFCVVITAITFASKGIAGNHVIALNALCLVIIGRGLITLRVPLIVGFISLSVIVVATWMPGVPSPRTSLVERANPSVSQVRETIASWRTADGPVFSIHPAFPVAIGERPVLLDGFNLRRFLAEGHPAADDFLNRVKAKEFSVVILDWEDDFDGAFLERYETVDQLGRFKVMVPRP